MDGLDRKLTHTYNNYYGRKKETTTSDNAEGIGLINLESNFLIKSEGGTTDQFYQMQVIDVHEGEYSGAVK